MTNKTFFDMTADLLTNHEDRLSALENIKGEGLKEDDARDIVSDIVSDALDDYIQEGDLESRLDDYFYYNDYVSEDDLNDKIGEYARENDLVSADEVEDIISMRTREDIYTAVDAWMTNTCGDIIDNAIADRLACFTEKLTALYNRVFPEQIETAEGGAINE